MNEAIFTKEDLRYIYCNGPDDVERRKKQVLLTREIVRRTEGRPWVLEGDDDDDEEDEEEGEE